MEKSPRKSSAAKSPAADKTPTTALRATRGNTRRQSSNDADTSPPSEGAGNILSQDTVEPSKDIEPHSSAPLPEGMKRVHYRQITGILDNLDLVPRGVSLFIRVTRDLCEYIYML
jgi:hypothetical protein